MRFRELHGPEVPSTFSLVLSLNIRLRAPLGRLPIIMLTLIPLLSLTIARKPSSRTPKGTLSAILDAAAEVAQLALSLLTLASLVLLQTFLPQAIEAESVAHGLLACTNGLVPAAFGAAGVVFGDTTGAGHVVGAYFPEGVGGVFGVFTFSFARLAFAL